MAKLLKMTQKEMLKRITTDGSLDLEKLSQVLYGHERIATQAYTAAILLAG